MKRIGLFGGSFNPVHKGHVLSAKAFLEAFSLDKVVLIPSNIPPHKEKLFSVSDEDRLLMLRKSIEGEKGLEVCDFELKRDQVSYTYYTLTEMKKQYESAELYFLLGTDMLMILDRWYKAEELKNLATFVCAEREEGDKAGIEAKKAELQEMGFKIELLKSPPFPVSSTEIREKIKKGEDPSEFIPESVWSYIRERGLYV